MALPVLCLLLAIFSTFLAPVDGFKRDSTYELCPVKSGMAADRVVEVCINDVKSRGTIEAIDCFFVAMEVMEFINCHAFYQTEVPPINMLRLRIQDNRTLSTIFLEARSIIANVTDRPLTHVYMSTFNQHNGSSIMDLDFVILDRALYAYSHGDSRNGIGFFPMSSVTSLYPNIFQQRRLNVIELYGVNEADIPSKLSTVCARYAAITRGIKIGVVVVAVITCVVFTALCYKFVWSPRRSE